MASSASKPSRYRLDVALVERGLAPSREKAQALIMAGRVWVEGKRRDKPGLRVASDEAIDVSPGRRPFASRGGEKLSPVLAALGIDPQGLACLDVGASTGGFTDVLLRRGAARVTAVDVGRGLLDARLREDPRVTVLEGVNARHLRSDQLAAPYDLVTMDLSFISLTLVLDPVLSLAPGGQLLALVKPQFEAGREAVGAGGVVRDRSARAGAVKKICHALAARGWAPIGVRASPLTGPKGNREVFVHARRGAPRAEHELDRWIDEEIDRAAE